MRSMFLRAAAVALALVAMPRAADAAWMAGFGGSSLVSSPAGTADGVINYAVWQNNGLNGGDLFAQIGIDKANELAGTTGTAYKTAQYAYVYEIVNTKYNTNAEAVLSGFFIEVNQGNLAGVAYATNSAGTQGYVFSELVGVTTTKVGPGGDTGNHRLDGGAVEDHTNAGAPVTTIGQPNGVALDSAAVRSNITADWDFFPPSGATQALKFTFQNDNGTGIKKGINTNGFSTLLIVTSNYRPEFSGGSLQDGGNAMGSVPVPTPEPATIAMFGMALPLLGFGYFRRQKTKAEPAIA